METVADLEVVPRPMFGEWRIELALSSPLSLNHRQHYMVRAKKVAQVRALARDAIREFGLPEMRHLRAWIEYQPRDSRRRDPINLIPTLKACEDALVDCSVVPDDNPEYVESVMPKILPKVAGEPGRLWLVVEED